MGHGGAHPREVIVHKRRRRRRILVERSIVDIREVWMVGQIVRVMRRRSDFSINVPGSRVSLRRIGVPSRAGCEGVPAATGAGPEATAGFEGSLVPLLEFSGVLRVFAGVCLLVVFVLGLAFDPALLFVV